jgi:hypothetical protein
MMAPGARDRALLAAASGVLVALPFLVVRFPPITDLPQHVAQIRLLLETIGHPASPYTIQWFTPYALVYGVIGAAWAAVGPLAAGRVAMLGIGLLWMAAIHGLAAARGRSPAAATLASALFFSHNVYWGFYNFVFTWPIFLLWLYLTTGKRARRTGGTDLAALLGCAALLYMSHILWLAVAILWLVLSGFAFRVPVAVLALRLTSVTPVLVGAALWYPHLAARGFRSPTMWGPSPLVRVTPRWLVSAGLGGLTGPIEGLVLGGIALWLVAGFWGCRRPDRARGAIDREWLLAAGLLLVLALLLPIQHTNTIRFAERWAPCAIILALLAVPAPRIRPLLQRGVAVGLLGILTLTTAAVWRTFERANLAGLQAALDALPARPRVIGLDYVGSTPLLNGRPFLQTFAYAQVIHGGTLNFSFAEFAPSLVVYADRRRVPWAPNLEWFPERVRPGDFLYFDYALINGGPDLHRSVPERFPVMPVTTSGTWRLYATRGGKPPDPG